MKTRLHLLPSVVKATEVLKSLIPRDSPISGARLQRAATPHMSFYNYYRTLAFLQECGKVEKRGHGKGSSYTWIGTEK